MTDLSHVLETLETDDQLSIAIKMIISSFENQHCSLNTEIGRLAVELTKSNNRIFDQIRS